MFRFHGVKVHQAIARRHFEHPIRLPAANRKGVGHNPRANLEFLPEFGAQARVQLGQQIQGDDGGVAHVGGEQILLHYLDLVEQLLGLDVGLGVFEKVRFDFEADAARAALCGGNHDACIAAAEVIDYIAGFHLGGVEHARDHAERSRFIHHVRAFAGREVLRLRRVGGAGECEGRGRDRREKMASIHGQESAQRKSEDAPIVPALTYSLPSTIKRLIVTIESTSAST